MLYIIKLHTISLSLSQRHSTFWWCGWRNGQQYRQQLRIVWITIGGRPIMCLYSSLGDERRANNYSSYKLS